MPDAHSNARGPFRRVMFFCDSFTHGGSERQMLHLLRLLDRSKYQVSVACLKRQGPFLPDVEQLGVTIHELPLHSLRSFDAVRWIFRFARLLRRERIELLQTFEFYGNAIAVPAARWAGVPVVLASRRELAGDRTSWQQRAIRLACWLAHGIVANSRAAGSRLIGLTDSDTSKVTVIPNGISLEEFEPEMAPADVREALGLNAACPLVGTLGALRPEKDYGTFLRAAARVAGAVPQARFVLIGEGSERARLQALARELGLTERVLFAGDRKDVANLLNAVDVFVLSSITESFPNAVLEAMAVGRPVVATKSGGTPELVEDGKTGYLVPVGDAEAMAARIVELLHKPELRRNFGASGRARVEREFTPARMKQRFEELYDRMLREHSPTARILQIGNFPPPVCGWSLHTQLVDRELRQRGADARVLDIGPGRRIPDRGCDTVQSGLDYARKLLRYRMASFTFHVHVNGDSWKGYLLALAAVLVGRLTARPSVLTFHAGPSQLYFPREHGLWHWAFKLLFAASGEVICNHEPVKRAIVSYGIPEGKVHPIPAFSVQYREEIPVPLPETVQRFLEEHEPRLFCYALFRPEFTMEALLEAFAAVRRDFPRAGLLIAGPQEVPAEFEKRVESLGLDSSILIPGNMPHAEFLTAVQRSDVFVRTHLRDGVCSSVLEALSLGVPVVAAEDGIRPPSVVKYAPGDAADLHRKLVEVLQDLQGARARVQPPETSNHLRDEVELLLSAGGAETMRLRESGASG
jgi:glycosyltransferase involved in cell wall biosynthesis